ncbi:MAG: hypothetical protein JNL95_05210 [Chitinophagales bacterium]|nr:hypothetical protein [Chitinophagales bacterium]
MHLRLPFYVLIVFLFHAQLQAQDVMKLKNEQLLKVKVVEVSQTEIKYKLYENQDGPTYTIDKADAVEITYANGVKESIDSTQSMSAARKQKLEEIAINKEKRRLERIEKAKLDYERYMQIYNRRIKGARSMLIAGPTVFVGGIGLTALGGYLMEQYDPGGYDYGVGYKKPTGNLGAALGSLIPGVLMLYTGLGFTVAGGIKFAMARNAKHRADDAKAILSFEPSVLPNYTALNDRSSITGFSLKLKF